MNVGQRRRSQGPIFVHDVDHGVNVLRLAGQVVGDHEPEHPLVVEMRESFVAVQRLLVLIGDLPDPNRDAGSGFRLDGQVGAGLAAAENELPVLQGADPGDGSAGAPESHLVYVQVAAVGDVVFFLHGCSPFK